MEYARNSEGSGYWVEAAYRLRKIDFWKPFFRRSQVVFRAEQFFAPSHIDEIAPDEDGHPGNDHEDLAFSLGGHGEEGGHAEEGGHHGRLPEVDTQRLMVGWNYYLSDGLKLSFSYGRNLNSDGNLLSLGLTYRFLF